MRAGRPVDIVDDVLGPGLHATQELGARGERRDMPMYEDEEVVMMPSIGRKSAVLEYCGGRLCDDAVQRSCGPSIGDRQEPHGLLAREEAESGREERFSDFLKKTAAWIQEPGENKGERSSNLFCQRENLDEVPIPDGAVPSMTHAAQEVSERTVSPS